jgi:hypothetical protein
MNWDCSIYTDGDRPDLKLQIVKDTCIVLVMREGIQDIIQKKDTELQSTYVDEG